MGSHGGLPTGRRVGPGGGGGRMGALVERRITRQLDCAEREGSCLVPRTEADGAALRYRGLALVCPLRGMFVRRRTWRRLRPPERMRYLMRGLIAMHPRWTFCGVSAAVAYRLPVTWALMGRVCVAAPPRPSWRGTSGIEFRTIADDESELVDGLPVTSPLRTLFDCARNLPLAYALPIADGWLRMFGGTPSAVARAIRERYRGHRGVGRAARVVGLADARAESGGESVARAVMVELGFAVPELQAWVRDPVDARRSYRVDFAYVGTDGRLHLGELDGRRKTEDPVLTRGRTKLQELARERIRESRITACGASVVRFSYDDVVDRPYFERVLSAFALPRRAESDLWPPAPQYVTTSVEVLEVGRWTLLASNVRAD